MLCDNSDNSDNTNNKDHVTFKCSVSGAKLGRHGACNCIVKLKSGAAHNVRPLRHIVHIAGFKYTAKRLFAHDDTFMNQPWYFYEPAPNDTQRFVHDLHPCVSITPVCLCLRVSDTWLPLARFVVTGMSVCMRTVLCYFVPASSLCRVVAWVMKCLTLIWSAG